MAAIKTERDEKVSVLYHLCSQSMQTGCKGLEGNYSGFVVAKQFSEVRHSELDPGSISASIYASPTFVTSF